MVVDTVMSRPEYSLCCLAQTLNERLRLILSRGRICCEEVHDDDK